MNEVLIVEDNPLHAKLAAAVLTNAGYSVSLADTAAEGVRLAIERKPALIIMDIKLPDGNGLDVVRKLKANDATSAIPVIAVTSYLDAQPTNEALAAGCAGFIAKPYHYTELIEYVALLIKKAQGAPNPENL